MQFHPSQAINISSVEVNKWLAAASKVSIFRWFHMLTMTSCFLEVLIWNIELLAFKIDILILINMWCPGWYRYRSSCRALAEAKSTKLDLDLKAQLVMAMSHTTGFWWLHDADLCILTVFLALGLYWNWNLSFFMVAYGHSLMHACHMTWQWTWIWHDMADINMTWHEMTWHDMTWPHMTSHDKHEYDMTLSLRNGQLLMRTNCLDLLGTHASFVALSRSRTCYPRTPRFKQRVPAPCSRWRNTSRRFF